MHVTRSLGRVWMCKLGYLCNRSFLMQGRAGRRKVSGPPARDWQSDFLLWPFSMQNSMELKDSKFECGLQDCCERLCTKIGG